MTQSSVLRKAIILAGGSGTRLRPITTVINKHLVPVYDKPMVLYALSTVMLSNIRDVLIISHAENCPQIATLLGDGAHLGMNIQYASQETPAGLPDAYLIGRDFLDGAPSLMTLGDNLFHGSGLSALFREQSALRDPSIFLFYKDNPRPYGVAVLDENDEITDVVEKPEKNISNYAVSGLYLFDERASDIAAELTPSARGELEIVDMIRWYLKNASVSTVFCNRGMTWMDMGTPDRLLEASNYVQLLEKFGNLKICVPEEIAWRNGWIDTEGLMNAASRYSGTPYCEYLHLLPDMPRPILS